jgi:hypothetical protein
LKCDAGEGWRRSVGLIRCEMKCYKKNEERNILPIIKRRWVTWNGHILHRNCRLKHIIDGKIEGMLEVTGRRGRTCMKLLDDLKGKRVYWKLKEVALDCTLWRTNCGRGNG